MMACCSCACHFRPVLGARPTRESKKGVLLLLLLCKCLLLALAPPAAVVAVGAQWGSELTNPYLRTTNDLPNFSRHHHWSKQDK